VEKCELYLWNDWNAVILLKTHKVKETRELILITTKSENWRAVIDLEDEMIKAETLHPKAVGMTISRLY
jgi:hypothetical protein